MFSYEYPMHIGMFNDPLPPTSTASESGPGGRRPGAAAGRPQRGGHQRRGLRRAAVAAAAPRSRWVHPAKIWGFHHDLKLGFVMGIWAFPEMAVPPIFG